MTGRVVAGATASVTRLYLSLLYLARHRRWPNLDRPARFTEWVQWRKLHDRDPSLARLSDKLAAKAFADEMAGTAIAVPTIWSGADLPEAPPAPLPLVVKPNHGCRQIRIVREASDWPSARQAVAGWVRRRYGAALGEWHYRAARPLVIVEPFVGEGDALPDDDKVYVFGGRAAIVQHHVGRGTRRHRWSQFDCDWRRVGGAESNVPAPPHLAQMLAAAEAIGAGFDFLRVDFYDVGGRLWFGEVALFPGSGLDPFDPVTLDDALGALWSEARAG